MLFSEWLENKLIIEAESYASSLWLVEAIQIYFEQMGPEHHQAAQIIRAVHAGQRPKDEAYRTATELIFNDIERQGRRLVRTHPIVRRNPGLEDEVMSFLQADIWNALTDPSKPIPPQPNQMEPWLRQHIQWAAQQTRRSYDRFVPPAEQDAPRRGDWAAAHRGGRGGEDRKGTGDSGLDIAPDKAFGGSSVEQRPDLTTQRKELHGKLFNCIQALAKQGEDGNKSAIILLRLYGFEPKPETDPMDVNNYEFGQNDRNPDWLGVGGKYKPRGVSDSMDEPTTGTKSPKSLSGLAKMLDLGRTEFRNRAREGKSFLRHCLVQHGVEGRDVGGVETQGDNEE